MFKNHPKGLIAAALSNMGERFGYYIMNAVLVLFLCSKFGIPDTQSSIIYSVFYCGIYVLSLVGGIIADRTQNYKGTIQTGLIVMALGYVALAIPITASSDNTAWLLPFTCVALFLIAFGNGLFKGNLQAMVGQLYDNFEAEAAKQGPEALAKAKGQRDSGFQIFYVFINVGGLVAPFVAPLLRSWWLKSHDLIYNAALPKLCHDFLNAGGKLPADQLANIESLAQQVTGNPEVVVNFGFCQNYLQIFNEGVHYSFIASVAAMVLSLTIFLVTKKGLPEPSKKAAKKVEGYTQEEKLAMATEIKQRMAALFAVLGICIFFWLSFHQNGQSLSLFARDFVKTDAIAPEIWQAVNPFFVIVLTPIIMAIFAALSRKGKEVSTPRKIAIGMGITGLAYLFLTVFSAYMGWPSGEAFRALPVAEADAQKAGWWVLILTYFFLTVAELFISPLGLSFVSKVAPKNMQGLCQGLWLGATAIGNLFIFVGPIMYNAWPIWKCWTVFLVICLVAMSVMLGMVKWLEKITKA
ncbi:MAG: peptide MFS transporter [Bacteroidales bacterium]|nr:peptide MFS transporter [Candidatus Cryptobacteroides equifaecalis]